MSKQKILIADPSFRVHPFYDPKILEELQEKFELVPNLEDRLLTAEEIISLGKDCVGIVAGIEKYSKETLDQLEELKVISRAGTGMDGIDLKYAKEKGIEIRNVSGTSSQAVAELTLGLILSLLRNIPEMNKNLHKKDWSPKHGEMLYGKTVGIIGIGEIGRRVGGLMRAFGAKVIAYDLYPNVKWAEENKVKLVTKDELLKEVDIVILSLSFNPDNAHMIGKDQLEQMKAGARIVNLSRGGLIDEVALMAALKSGHIAGAALDVFEAEPYVGELTEFKQVILTPHIGASTIESRKFMQEQGVNNLIESMV